MKTVAWMLRNDGAAFECIQHLYCMRDADLSSEAEVASFIVSTNSKDKELCYYVLDAWMAMLIENSVSYDADESEIDSQLEIALNNLHYKFPYPLTVSEYVDIHRSQNNYTDIDTLYNFIDDVRLNIETIWSDMEHSLSQQFCRVRYGGQYNSPGGNSTIWFRISSVGFNWANIIYIFTSEYRNKLGIDKITICRDYESDNGDNTDEPEYFYKAKDGAIYYDMPVDEFLQEEHEHSLVFSKKSLNAGVIATIRNRLSLGDTEYEIACAFGTSNIPLSSAVYSWKRFIRQEQLKCIDASEFLDTAPRRTQSKIRIVMRKIQDLYPEIKSLDVDAKPYNNSKGKPLGIEYIYTISSDTPELNGLSIGTAFTKSSITPDMMLRQFMREYDSYLEYKKIRIK